MDSETVSWIQLLLPKDVESISDELEELISPYLHILTDYWSPQTAKGVVQNLKTYTPYVWVLMNKKRILTASHLSDVFPKQHACLHGVRAREQTRHPEQTKLENEIFRVCFEELSLHKIKAVFDGDNSGAESFCKRYGFIKEGHLKQEGLRKDGTRPDLVTWAYFRYQWEQSQTKKLITE